MTALRAPPCRPSPRPREAPALPPRAAGGPPAASLVVELRGTPDALSRAAARLLEPGVEIRVGSVADRT